MPCSHPAVAVCIVGQFRGSVTTGLLQETKDRWLRVGDRCIDFYLMAGIEAQDPTWWAKNGCRSVISDERKTALRILQPVRWRMWNGSTPVDVNASIPDLKFDLRHDDVHGTSECIRPSDFNSKSVLCGANQSVSDCKQPSCTHCQYPTHSHVSAASVQSQFHRFLLNPVYRLQLCVNEVRHHEHKIGRKYTYFAFQRPDMHWMGVMPPLTRWSSLLPKSNRTYTALFCPSSEGCTFGHCVPDYFALMRREAMQQVFGNDKSPILNTYAQCQSRQTNIRFGGDAHKYFVPETVMHVSFARQHVQPVSARVLHSCRLERRCTAT